MRVFSKYQRPCVEKVIVQKWTELQRIIEDMILDANPNFNRELLNRLVPEMRDKCEIVSWDGQDISITGILDENLCENWCRWVNILVFNCYEPAHFYVEAHSESDDWLIISQLPIG